LEPVIHKLYLPEDDEQVRLAVTPPGMEMEYFEVPDMESLFEALNYGNTYPYARECALNALKSSVEYHKERIWNPLENDGCGEMKDFLGVRRNVWELVRNCCIQERNLLDAASKALEAEMSK
jgi:hypothetical protein